MKTCSKCKKVKALSEFSPRKDRVGKYLSACKECRTMYYKSKRPTRTTLVHASYSDSLRYHKAKRSRRTKNAFIAKTEEFNLFVLEEAHILRKNRNKYTGIFWHVDHIIPLQHSLVCGLHFWTNIQVIPAKENWSKNNAFST